jgi:tetratricopeptide (TPR) repeat protein
MFRRLRHLLVALLVATAAGGCVDKPTEHRVRANAYLRGGDAEKALAECDSGLAESPGDVSLMILRGKALFELGRYPQARQAYQQALEAGASLEARALGEARLGLAMVAIRTEDWAEARKHFQALVDANGRDADARINLARVCLQLDELPCALEHGIEAGHLRGSDESVLFTLGRIYVVAKKYDEAEKTFQHICEVVSGAASCPYGLALVAAQRGQRDEALDKLREAVNRKLPNPEKLADDPLLAPIEDEVEFRKIAAKAADR